MINERLERADDTVWHSVKEWILGYTSVNLLTNKGSSVVTEVASFLNRHISCDLKGQEIYTFLQKGWAPGKHSSTRGAKYNPIIPLDDPYLALISSGYKNLKKLNITDFAAWILTPNPPKDIAIWRFAVYSLGLDIAARDYYVHLAYVRTLSTAYPEHDSSKKSLLEIILNTVIVKNPAHFHWARIPHLARNDHHPEHTILAVMYPNLTSQLLEEEKFENIYSRLVLIANELEI